MTTPHSHYRTRIINHHYFHPLFKPKPKPKPKPKTCLIFFLISIMTSSFFILYFLFLFSPSSATTAPSPQIYLACRATRYPDTCQSMLTPRLDPAPSTNDVIQLALSASNLNLQTGRAMVQEILNDSAQNQNRSRAARTCLEVLQNAAFRSYAASGSLSRGLVRDARALTSAALCYQYDCWSGLKYVNDSALVNQTMSYFDTTLLVSTSNALSMLRALDALGPDLLSWGPPRTERNGFWEPVVNGSSWFGGRVGFEFGLLTVNATVCKDDVGCFRTVQAAVDAAPEGLEWWRRYVIKIKEGVYEETVRVGFNKTNLVFIGDGIGKTVITGSLNAGMQGITTYNTATVGVLGDGFMASGLTFQNTAGPDTHQAVAFRSDSDFSYVENCEFLGNQDTVYVHSLRQFYNSCRIEGNVDFIFGNAAAIFQNCTILVRPRQIKPEKGETNAIAAHGRTDPAQTTGFAFLSCLINGTDDYMALYRSKPSKHKNYLARPWKLYSRTVYINCTLEALISPEGWLPWSGDFALSTLYYGEYGNTGAGANISDRVPWSRQIPAEHISTYYVQNFLQGDEWITSASYISKGNL